MGARHAILTLAWIAAAGCGAPDHPAPPARPDLVLITIDTLRADHLGSYGHPLEVSPHIDRLAAEGVRFAEATAQWPTTWPSLASLLTGTYPGRNGVVWEPKRPLDWSQRTLAELLKAAGYRTGAVVSNTSIGRRMQFHQGFDSFVESWQGAYRRENPDTSRGIPPIEVKEYTNATIVTDLALAWLERQPRNAPFFAWIHYMDPHGPYRPPAQYQGLYGDAYPERTIALDSIPEHQRLVPPGESEPSRDLGYYTASYDREIRYLDDELGRLLAALDRRWGEARGLVVFTADHGESFDEHGEILGHGRTPFRPTTRVPLILHMPGRLPAGREIEAPVGLVALLPTLLELLGLPPTETAQEASLLPWIDGDPPDPAPPVFGHAGLGDPPQTFLRRGHFKLVRFHSDRDIARFGGRLALYDLERDPGETRNAIEEHPRVAERMRQELEDWLAENWRVTRGGKVRFDPVEREMLRQLGYGR